MPQVDINDQLREQILEEAKSRIPTPPASDEVTASSLALELGCTQRQARDVLADLVEEGVATVRTNGIENNCNCKVYKMEIK